MNGGDVGKLADLAEQAARLCKADLVTEMVGEFPELQGLMGGYYARAEGLPDAVADAIRDHYKPVGQGDDVPTASVTVAVSLADKLDTICSFFEIDEKPTGSKDPFALRRAALGIVALVRSNDLRLSILHSAFTSVAPRLIAAQFEQDRGPLKSILPSITYVANRANAEHFLKAIVQTVNSMPDPRKPNPDVFFKGISIAAEVRDFLLDRLEVTMKAEGGRVDTIRAAQIIDGDCGKEDDLVRLLARVKALQSFIATDDGANLLAGYKRAANILKKEGYEYGVPAKAGTQGDEALLDSELRPSPEHGGVPPQAGEEDPGAALTDPDVAQAIRQHEAVAPLSYTPEPAEATLIAALDGAEPRAAAAVESEDFEGAMAALASLRAPIDAFFDSVTVNDPEQAKRAARLSLLERVRVAVHKVADFSKISG